MTRLHHRDDLLQPDPRDDILIARLQTAHIIVSGAPMDGFRILVGPMNREHGRPVDAVSR